MNADQARTLLQGDCVVTPRGLGTVAYVRMAAPNYSKIEAVSVVLESFRGAVGYSGTIFPIERIEKRPN